MKNIAVPFENAGPRSFPNPTTEKRTPDDPVSQQMMFDRLGEILDVLISIRIALEEREEEENPT